MIIILLLLARLCETLWITSVPSTSTEVQNKDEILVGYDNEKDDSTYTSGYE